MFSMFSGDFRDNLGSIASLGVGVGAAAFYVKKVKGQSLLEYLKDNNFYTVDPGLKPIENIIRPSITSAKEYVGLMRSRNSELSQSLRKNTVGFLNSSWNDEVLFAVKDAIMDMSLESRYSKMFSGSPMSLYTDLQNISTEEQLKGWITTNLTRPGAPVGLEDIERDIAIKTSRKMELGKKRKGQSFKGLVSDRYERMFSRTPVVFNNVSDYKGGNAKVDRLLGILSKAGELEKDNPLKVRIQRGRTAFEYLNVKTKSGGNFLLPMDKYRSIDMNGKLVEGVNPYFFGPRGNSILGMRGQFTSISPDGISDILDWEDEFFYGENPRILEFLKESKTSNKSIIEQLAGFDSDNVWSAGEYIEDDERGIMSLLKKSTEVEVKGLDELKEAQKLSQAELYGLVEKSFAEKGYTAYAYGSPAQTGKSILHAVKEGETPPLFGTLGQTENYLQQRRPLQMFSGPDIISNVAEMRERFAVGRLSEKVNIFDPFDNPAFNSGPLSSIENGFLDSYVRNLRGVFLTKKGNEINMADVPDGSFMAVRRPGTRIRRRSSRVNIFVPEDGAIGISKRIAPLISIADSQEDPLVRRQLIAKALEGRRNSEFTSGEFLGKGIQNNEIIDITAPRTGKLLDIVPKGSGYDLVFESMQRGSGEKYFGGAKVLRNRGNDRIKSMVGDIERRLNISHFKLLEGATGSHELLKEGQFGFLRQQQLEALKMISAGKLLKSGSPLPPRPQFDKVKLKRRAARLVGKRHKAEIRRIMQSSHLGISEKGVKAKKKAIADFRRGKRREIYNELLPQAKAFYRKQLGDWKNIIEDRLKGIGSDSPALAQALNRMSQPEYLQNVLSGNFSSEVSGILDRLKYEGRDRLRIGSGLSLLQEAINIDRLNPGLMTSENLGLIFGIENDIKTSLLDLVKDDTVLDQLGGSKSFGSAFTQGVKASTMVVGGVPVSVRGGVREFKSRAARVERRAVEHLLHKTPGGYIDIETAAGPKSTASILLEDLAYGLGSKDDRKHRGILRIMNAYADANKKIAINDSLSLNYIIKGMRADLGGFVDVSKISNIAGDNVYIPNEDLLTDISPKMSLGDSDIEQGYRQALSRFQKEGTPEALEALRAEELKLGNELQQYPFRGKISHARGEKISPDTKFVTDPIDPDLKYTRGQGMGIGMSKKTIEARAKIARELLTDPTQIAEFDEMVKGVLTEGKFAPVAYSRSPAITPFGRNIALMWYDESLDKMSDAVYSYGQRFEKGANVSFGLAAASSHDFDGDMQAVNFLLSRNIKENYNAFNDSKVQEALAQNAARTVKAHAELESLFTENLNRLYGGDVIKNVSSFVEGAVSLSGQKEIGLLSYNIDRLKWAARLSEVNAQSFTSELERLQHMMYVMEQKGIGFKHIKSGRSVGEIVTERIGEILSDEIAPKERAYMFNTLLSDFFGNTEARQRFETEFSEDFVNSLHRGIEILNTREGQSAYRIVKDKSENINLEKLNKAREKLNRAGSEVYSEMTRQGRLLQDIIPSVAMMTEMTDSSGIGEGEAARTVKEMNERVLEKAGNVVKDIKFNKLAKVAGVGLAASALTYSLFFDRGYAGTTLEAPTPNPQTGKISMTPVGIQEAIANRTLLSGSGGEAMGMRANADQMAAQIPNEYPNSMPRTSYLDRGTGRITLRSNNANLNPNQMAAMINASMPGTPGNITINHSFKIRRDMERDL